MQPITLPEILARLATGASPIAVELSTRAEFIELLNTLQAKCYEVNNIEHISEGAALVIRIGEGSIAAYGKVGITCIPDRNPSDCYKNYPHYTYKPNHLVFTKAR